MTERFSSDFSEENRQPQIREVVSPDGTVKRYRAVDAYFHREIGVARDGRSKRGGFGERPRRAFD